MHGTERDRGDAAINRMVLFKAEWSRIAKTVDCMKRFADRVAKPYSMGVIALEFVAATGKFLFGETRVGQSCLENAAQFLAPRASTVLTN